MENSSYEMLVEEFRRKIAPYKQAVSDEFVKREQGLKPPVVVSGLPADLAEIAERLVALQKQNGSFARRDMLASDFAAVQALASKYSLSNKQAVAMLVENDRYMSPETVEVENICNLIEDIFVVYTTHYENIGAFPVNALSKKSRDYLANKKINIGLTDKLKILIAEYIPEFSNMNIVDKSYKAVPRYRFDYNDKVARAVAKDLVATYGDEKGLVDSIFSSRNEVDLNKLLSMIGERGISFDDFASKYGVKYTKCYEMDSVPTVLQMIMHYYRSMATFRGITRNDPYLRQKIDTVEKHTSNYSLGSYLELFGIQHDSLDNGQGVTGAELKLRESLLSDALSLVYKDGVISAGFLKKHPDLYEECLNLSARKGYDSVDSYLASLNFSRVKQYDKKASGHVITLTERDLKHYGIWPSFAGAEIENVVERYGMKLADVEHNRALYNKLVALKEDCTKHKNKKPVTQFGE